MAFLSDVFGRMGRVARGEANAGVDALEDATFETTVRQTVADMRTELNKVVNASAMAMSNYNRLDAEYQKYVRQSQEWKDRAGVALDAGNEDLARKALAKKAECDQQVASMQTAVNAAMAQRKVSEAMAGVGNADNAFSQLNKFEQSVAKDEATAKAFDQLASAGKDDDLEAQFAALGSHSVDTELAALKAERQKGKLPAPTVPKELSAGAAADKTGA